MTKTLRGKDPDEVFDYRWAVELDEGDSLAVGAITVTSGTVTIDQQDQDATGVTFWLSGGVDGEIAVLRAFGTTAGGRKVEDLFHLPVTAKDAVRATTLVTVDEVKRHLKLEPEDKEEDDLLAAYIEAAIDSIDGPEGWLGRAIVPRTFVHRFTGAGAIRLPYPPIIEIEGITVTGSDGADQVLDIAHFELEGRELHHRPGSPAGTAGWWCRAGRVTYRAGYTRLPRPMHQAVLLMVGDLYRSRSTFTVGVSASSTPMSLPVETLLAPFRVFY